MKKERKLIFLNMLFIMSLIVANVVAGKVVSIFGFIVPSAVVAYGVTFLCTDIIGELYGKDEANATVKMGFIIQLCSLALILFAIQLPAAPFAVEYSQNFKIVLSQSSRVVVASLIAYLVSQANDVYIFHKLKDKTNGKHKWLRNNLSTMTSQFIDTAIFISIAFYGEVPNLLWMIISQYFIKFIIALCDTPFFYYFTKENK